MFDVITIGSATRDVFINADFLDSEKGHMCLPLGYKFDIESPFTQTGGGATNTAVSFSRLGLKTGIITRIGNDDAGHLVKHNLNHERVNTRLLMKDKDLGTALSVIFYKTDSDRTLFVYRGASQNISLNEIKLSALKTRWFYITALRDSSINILKPLLQFARKHNIKVAMNPGSKELKMSWLLKYVDVLLLNKEEAEMLAKHKGKVKEIIKRLHRLGPSIVAVTDGDNRIFVCNENRIYSAVPYNVVKVNTVGAGDAFCSGFVSALVKNNGIKEAIKLGLLNASSVIQHVGAKVGLLDYKKTYSYERSLHLGLVIKEEQLEVKDNRWLGLFKK